MPRYSHFYLRWYPATANLIQESVLCFCEFWLLCPQPFIPSCFLPYSINTLTSVTMSYSVFCFHIWHTVVVTKRLLSKQWVDNAPGTESNHSQPLGSAEPLLPPAGKRKHRHPNIARLSPESSPSWTSLGYMSVPDQSWSQRSGGSFFRTTWIAQKKPRAVGKKGSVDAGEATQHESHVTILTICCFDHIRCHGFKAPQKQIFDHAFILRD